MGNSNIHMDIKTYRDIIQHFLKLIDRTECLNFMLICKEIRDICLEFAHTPWESYKIYGGSKKCGLIHACENGHLEYYRKWRAVAGENLKLETLTSSPFNIACANGHLDLVRLLHEQEYERFKELPFYNVALAVAIQQRYIEIVRFLKQYTNIPTRIVDIERAVQLVTYALEITRILLNDRNLDLEGNTTIIEAACRNRINNLNDYGVIDLLLDDPRIRPTNLCLENMAAIGNLRLFKRILAYENINPGDVGQLVFERAAGGYVENVDIESDTIIQNRFEMLRILLSDPRVTPNFNLFTCVILPSCDLRVIGHLLQDPIITNLDLNYDLIMSHIIIQGKGAVVDLFLRNVIIFSGIQDKDKFGFIRHCLEGDINRVLATLIYNDNINDERIGVWGYEALLALTSAGYGYQFDVIKLLLEDIRISTSVNWVNLLQIAANSGDVTLLQMYLDHPSIDDGDMDNGIMGNEIYEEPIENGDIDIIKVLLSSGYINPGITSDGVQDAMPLLVAVLLDEVEIAKRLIEDGRIDPSFNNSETFQTACDHELTEVALELLKDPRIDPTADNNYALRTTFEFNYKEIFIALLNDSRIDDRVIKLNELNGYFCQEIVKILLDFRATKAMSASEPQSKRIKV